MLLDTEKTFAELHADGESLRAAMLDIQRYATDRQEALGWISRMRFLAPISSYFDSEKKFMELSGDHHASKLQMRRPTAIPTRSATFPSY